MSECDWSSGPPVPDGTVPLEHQVAGHVFGTGKTKLGFLKRECGTILKPVYSIEADQLACRRSELAFYQRVFSADCRDEVLLGLRPLIPRYVGTWSTPAHPGVTYIELQDIASRFSRPCIMDVKMGRITHAPDASPDKMAREKAKYPPALETGFTMLGIRVYSPENGEYVTLNRQYLRSLTAQQLRTKGLCTYLRVQDHPHPHIIRAFIKRLHDIKDWFLHQNRFHFYASSLLFVYEGDTETLDKTAESLIKQNGKAESSDAADLTAIGDAMSLTDIRMIDFPRVYPADNIDDNYVAGLNTLIEYLQQLL